MGDLEVESKPVSSDEKPTNGLSNGLPNGTPDHRDDKDRHRDKDKDRHRDKDRHKSSHKTKDREKDRDRSSKDKDRHSSSHRSSSHKDKDKDKDRHKDKDRKDKERSDKEKSKEKDESKDKDRHRDKDKDKEKSDRDKSRDKDRDKDKDRKKSSSNSSSSGDKKDKDRHHSSSHKSSHKDKSRDKERDKDKSKDKNREKEEKIKVEPEEYVPVKVEVKEEPLSNSFEGTLSLGDYTPNCKSESMVDSEEDTKLVIKEEKVEEEDPDDDDDNIPLASRKRVKVEEEEDDEDDKPLISRKKVKSEKKRKRYQEEEDEDDFKPQKKIKKEQKPMPKSKKKAMQDKKVNKSQEVVSPTKAKKKKEEEEHVWKWWEEKKRDDGVKWNFLEHKGPVLADPYIRLPSHVKFYYDKKEVALSENAEEVAGFYARMLDHDYTKKEVFNRNFFKDWRKVMTSKERELITDLSKCNFAKLHAFFIQLNEERKNRTKEEKKALKEKNEALIAEYGWCNIDGHKQRIGNFKIEPPGLFRGRGEHPKQGMLKKRTMPEDVSVNCSADSVIPKPPPGHRWKKVTHDNAVTWLACWNENITGSTKYVMLNAASKLKGEKDWQKYEMARRLHKRIDSIRVNYSNDWRSKEMRIRQRGVALYFIDKLALRAGNEKDEDQADTVGCCSLRVEHITLYERKDGKDYIVKFDFLGKDSIRYYNEVPVEKKVFKNLQLFMDNKQPGDDLFDRLNTQILNKYLSDLMEGLTAKVFRTYNASRTLQEQLERMTVDGEPLMAQVLAYNRANREVAILCNHQRAVPKTFDKSMANLQQKINEKREVVEQTERELKDLKKAAKHSGSVAAKVNYEKKKKALERLREQMDKLEMSATDKEENKQIALGTSKLNYLDPRISVAWCKKNNIPIEKVYNKTQRQKFQWAIDMATPDYNFLDDSNSQSFATNDNNNDDDEEDDDGDE